ncbi:MAG: PHP domain-containing protein, partial [Paraclostridium sp.]
LNDATITPKKLAKKAKEFGMNKVAVTDHGVMFNIPELYKALKYEGVELIIGMETYVAPRENILKEAKIDNANYHLVLLCENNEGYSNLIRIASNAAIDGFYYRARTDKEKLRKHSKGLIALSACLGGEVQSYLLDGNYEKAKATALEYQDIFGKGNFYLEIQRHGIKEQDDINPLITMLGKETGIPLVATNDCHYVEPDDWEAHDVLMAHQAGTTINDTKRKVYSSHEFYIKSQEEMKKLFSDYPEAISNTVKVANRCHVELEFGVNKLPPFTVPDSFKGTNLEYLKELCYKGAQEIYGDITKEVAERIEYEISIIDRMGYVNYFLITWDFFRFCKDGTFNIDDYPLEDWKPILVGPGRGSAAGSIVAYSLGITKICPLKYNLLFERE